MSAAAPPPPPPAAPLPDLARRRRPALQELGLVVVVVLIGAVLTLLSEPVEIRGVTTNNFLRADNLIGNVLTPMSWIAIMAVGVTVVIVAGGIDISVGSICGLSALATAAVLQGPMADAADAPARLFAEQSSAWAVLPVAVLVALGVGLGCGLINGLLVVGLRMHPFIVTLGTLSIFRGIALISVATKSIPVGDQTLPAAFTRHLMMVKVSDWWPVADPALASLQPVPMLIMLATVAVGWLFLGHSVWGREVYAVGGNEEAARFAGLPVGWIKLRVYALSGLCAGLAGLVMSGYYGSANTATGEGYELIVIAAAVVGGASLSGGRGTALGAVLGALVIKLIENGTFMVKKVDLGLVTLTLSKEYSKIVIGLAIIAAVAVDRVSEYWRSRRSRR